MMNGCGVHISMSRVTKGNNRTINDLHRAYALFVETYEDCSFLLPVIYKKLDAYWQQSVTFLIVAARSIVVRAKERLQHPLIGSVVNVLWLN